MLSILFFGATLLAAFFVPLDRAAAQVPFIQLVKTSSGTCSAVGDTIDYTYEVINSLNSEQPNLSVTDNRVATIDCGGATAVPANGSVICTGSYTVTAADISAGSITNTARAEAGQFGEIFVARDTETITCSEEADPRQTNAVTERFLHHRLTGLLNDEPDRPRFLRRFPGSLWGGGPGGNGSPFNVSQNGSQVAFSTSLSQMKQAVASAPNPYDDKAMALGSAALYERPGTGAHGGFDIWTEAHFSNYDDRGGADGNFNILYVGADYAVTNNWLIGLLGQFDWVDESTRADGSRIEGDGWMVGPYVSGRLTENLFFDWRAAWGSSDNDVTPFGTYTDNFDTDRWLTTARLTGNWTSGNWRLTPSVAVKYGEEQQDVYTDTLGFRIRGQDVSLGQVDFGPEFAYRWLLEDGTVVEPQLALYGVWNFEDSTLLLNGTTYSPDDFSGRLEGALQIYLPKGWAARGAVAYDGMGADYEAVSGKVWLNMPLN